MKPAIGREKGREEEEREERPAYRKGREVDIGKRPINVQAASRI
jgi:hypothetical protein